ncbi:unnamed protein product [Phytophthora fragariaefolia]|uniref:Unnamed protein product n=1 Tax=Phytophthora fragariaefolia TaxID=1490495 RepID=A0A9W6Y2D7_9STRA|nr:unnamed protein product [Phytophthora fragariaefolia]
MDQSKTKPDFGPAPFVPDAADVTTTQSFGLVDDAAPVNMTDSTSPVYGRSEGGPDWSEQLLAAKRSRGGSGFTLWATFNCVVNIKTHLTWQHGKPCRAGVRGAQLVKVDEHGHKPGFTCRT